MFSTTFPLSAPALIHIRLFILLEVSLYIKCFELSATLFFKNNISETL